MKRTDLSSIHNIPLMVRELTKEEAAQYRGDVIGICRASNRDLVAIVNRDDLFDTNGNRFACN